MDFQTSPLVEADTKADFTSRQAELNEFLGQRAWHFEQTGCGKTFVLRRPDDDPAEHPPLYGYYTLAMGTFDPQMLPDGHPEFPLTKIPVGFLCQLARDQRLPKEWKVGEWLLGDAVKRIVRAAHEIACVGIGLETEGEGLLQWYERYGFKRMKARKGRPKMFLPIQDAYLR